MSYNTSSWETSYNPVGAGANYAYLTQGVEDLVFHENAQFTQWKQKWSKYTPHQAANIIQALQNQGLGRTMSSALMKTPDFLFSTYSVSKWPGIKPNTDAGVSKCSYVNARAIYASKSQCIKIASQTIFSLDGHAQMCLMELHGMLMHFAKMIGYCMTRDQLIRESRLDTVLYAPWFGFPFHDRPDLAFAVGAIAFHGVTAEIQTRGYTEMVVNYDGTVAKGKGVYAIPLEIGTNKALTNDSVGFTLATNCVWVAAEERLSLINGYNETIFREVVRAGEYTIQAASTAQRVEFDVNIKGPCALLFVTVQARTDTDAGNWVKLCDDYGLDYISEFMLITGSTAREDGLPAAFYRTAKVVEAFKHKIDRYIYVLAFETDATSRQMTGHQNMTNAEKTKISMTVRPHADTALDVRADVIVYNGVYTERGSGGRVWG